VNIWLLRGKLEERGQLEDLVVDVGILLKCFFKKRDVSMNWNDLMQDRARWRAIVNAVMNPRFP